MLDLFEQDFLNKLKTDYRKVLENAGGDCPCCGRFGKYNGYSITKTDAKALVWIFVNGDKDGWVHMPTASPREFMRAKSFTNLRYWGLIEDYPNDSKEVKGSGLWRVTNKAIRYIRGEMQLPKNAFVFDRTLMGFSEKQVYFSECFKDYFNLEEVMNSRFERQKA
jgi:hypothetical protein